MPGGLAAAARGGEVDLVGDLRLRGGRRGGRCGRGRGGGLFVAGVVVAGAQDEEEDDGDDRDDAEDQQDAAEAGGGGRGVGGFGFVTHGARAGRGRLVGAGRVGGLGNGGRWGSAGVGRIGRLRVGRVGRAGRLRRVGRLDHVGRLRAGRSDVGIRRQVAPRLRLAWVGRWFRASFGARRSRLGGARDLGQPARRDVRQRARNTRGPVAQRRRLGEQPAGRLRVALGLLPEQVVGQRRGDLVRQPVLGRERVEPRVRARPHRREREAEQLRDVVVAAPLLEDQADDGALVGREGIQRAHATAH